MSVQKEPAKSKQVLKPFWTEALKEKLSHLWLPTERDLTQSEELSRGMVEKSWFSTNLLTSQKEITSCLSYDVDLKESDYEATKTRLNRLYPTYEQKKLFRSWTDASRHIYNMTVAELKKYSGNTPNWMFYWKDLIDCMLLPSWADSIPFQIKKIAVKDAIQSLEEGKKRVATGVIPRFEQKFRSKKNPVQSCYIPSSAIKDYGIYPQVTGSKPVTKSRPNGENILRYAEPLPSKPLDSRLVIKNGKFYLAIPSKYTFKLAENQGTRIVSIDPGIRSFHSFYDGQNAGHLAKGDFSRIQRLLSYADDLISRASNQPTQRKRRMLRAKNRLLEKVKNLIDELHHKVALFYVKNFDVILLPTFETSEMSKRSSRNTNSESVRNMLTFAHYRFSQFLTHKAKEFGKKVISVSEAYTSKTDPLTGEIRNVGSAKRLRVGNAWINRDLLGAFNIMLKALGDLPGLMVRSYRLQEPREIWTSCGNL